MPLDLCHSTAPHEKLKLPEWYVSNLMMDRALDAICRRVKKFDRKHRSRLSDEPNPRDLMRPFPAEPMQMWPISTRVEPSAREAMVAGTSLVENSQARRRRSVRLAQTIEMRVFGHLSCVCLPLVWRRPCR
jgi:hypothetical protein